MYDELYEAWRKEKENAEVQPLPKGFFDKLTQYVKRLREEGRMLDEKTTRARLLLRESKNVKKLCRELIQLRYEKVLRKVIAGETVVKEGLTDDEEKLFREIVTSTESYQNFLKGVLGGRSPSVEVKESAKKRVLRFLQGVPAVIGTDMKPYGPFKPEDVASVPAENARILVKQGLAVEVEVKI
jgi:DNA replication initiation complex subunit (GINS family)